MKFKTPELMTHAEDKSGLNSEVVLILKQNGIGV